MDSSSTCSMSAVANCRKLAPIDARTPWQVLHSVIAEREREEKTMHEGHMSESRSIAVY